MEFEEEYLLEDNGLHKSTNEPHQQVFYLI